MQRLAPDGRPLGMWGRPGTGPGELYGPQSLVIDRDGNVYVGDRYSERIQKFASDGTFLASWGSSMDGTGAESLALDAGEQFLLVTTSRGGARPVRGVAPGHSRSQPPGWCHRRRSQAPTDSGTVPDCPPTRPTGRPAHPVPSR
ncbi:MAG: hypothetical protein EB140_14530 [Proteobacteria bacterium]|nr:hypothetical protein [Pseudomonadota bacterium]